MSGLSKVEMSALESPQRSCRRPEGLAHYVREGSRSGGTDPPGAGGTARANTPQAKGRVERMNRTLQDRLVKELRLRQIASMDAANALYQATLPRPAGARDCHRLVEEPGLHQAAPSSRRHPPPSPRRPANATTHG
jgi:hypothetical protein